MCIDLSFSCAGSGFRLQLDSMQLLQQTGDSTATGPVPSLELGLLGNSSAAGNVTGNETAGDGLQSLFTPIDQSLWNLTNLTIDFPPLPLFNADMGTVSQSCCHSS